MNLQDATALALQVPCPVCKTSADSACRDTSSFGDLDRPHAMRLERAVIVTDAIAHNQREEVRMTHDALRVRYEAHRAEVPDYEGTRVVCCDGCELADALPALLDEIKRLRAGAENVIDNFEGTARECRDAGDKDGAEHNETLAWKLRRDILGGAQ